jgi:hypothetical protein
MSRLVRNPWLYLGLVCLAISWWAAVAVEYAPGGQGFKTKFVSFWIIASAIVFVVAIWRAGSHGHGLNRK